MLQESGIDPYLTVAEVLADARRLLPAPASVDEVIELVGLDEKRDAAGEDAVGRPATPPRRRARHRSATPSWSSSTSRRPASTRRRGARRGTSSGTCADLGKTDPAHHALHGRGAGARRPSDRHRRGADRAPRGRPTSIGGRADGRRHACRFSLPHGVTVADLPVRPRPRRRRSSSIDTTEPTASLHALTELGARAAASSLDGLTVVAPVARGHLPRAHRRTGRIRERRATVARQAGWEQKSFWRNPASAVVHLRVPADVPGDLHRDQRQRHGPPRRRHGASSRSTTCRRSSSFGLISACYTNLAFTLSHPPRERAAEARPRHTAVTGRLPRAASSATSSSSA